MPSSTSCLAKPWPHGVVRVGVEDDGMKLLSFFFQKKEIIIIFLFEILNNLLYLHMNLDFMLELFETVFLDPS